MVHRTATLPLGNSCESVVGNFNRNRDTYLSTEKEIEIIREEKAEEWEQKRKTEKWQQRRRSRGSSSWSSFDSR